MKEIIITIKPTLQDISDPTNLATLIGKIRTLITGNKDLLLESVGEEILRRAKENAEQGYDNVPFSGDDAVVWPRRHRITERLYELSPYHQDFSRSGLDTGRRKLIGSLERHGEDNIFDIIDSVIDVGPSFKHAALLEKGGDRPALPNIGFRADGSPNRWLSDAIANGLISEGEVAEIRNHLLQTQPIEGRPFLAPALRDVKDTGDFFDIIAQRLLEEIRVDLELEEVKIRSGEPIYVH